MTSEKKTGEAASPNGKSDGAPTAGKPRHEHAEGLPDWDLEPPVTLMRRGAAR